MARGSCGRDRVPVIAICGSLREGSYTRLALEVALDGARTLGAETRLLDLREYDLVFCDGRRDDSTYPEGVQRLRAEVRDAQGILLGTPEYHGAVSGVLKNALDLMGFDEFEGKVLGLIGVSAGEMGATNALTELRTIGRVLHAWVVPQQAAISQAHKVFTEEGEIASPKLAERVREVGRQVARFAYLHCSEKWREFLRLWEEAQPNPGG